MKWKRLAAILITTALIFAPLLCHAPEQAKESAYYPTMKDNWRFTIYPNKEKRVEELINNFKE